MPRGNPDNLKPVRSKSEASERGKKGGKASGEARAKKRDFKNLINTILECRAAPETIKRMVDEKKLPAGFTEEDIKAMDAKMLLSLRVVDATLTANNASDVFKGFATIQESIGEKPSDKVEVSGFEEILKKLSGKEF